MTTTTRRSRAGGLVAALLVASTATVGLAPAARASCATPPGSPPPPPAEEAFVGVALRGPTTPDGALLSPARFWVLRRLAGDGGRVERVDTAVGATPEGGYVEISVGIKPEAGEVWYVELRNGSAACTGSRSLVPDRPATP